MASKRSLSYVGLEFRSGGITLRQWTGGTATTLATSSPAVASESTVKCRSRSVKKLNAGALA